MWRDIDWHRELTDLIKSSKLPEVQGAFNGRGTTKITKHTKFNLVTY